LLIGGGHVLSFDKALRVSNMTYAITLPVMAGVEHFFTKWFAMGIAVADGLPQLQARRPRRVSWTFKVDLSTLGLPGLPVLLHGLRILIRGVVALTGAT